MSCIHRKIYFSLNILQGDITFSNELYNLKNDPYEQNNLIETGLSIEVVYRKRIRSIDTKFQR